MLFVFCLLSGSLPLLLGQTPTGAFHDLMMVRAKDDETNNYNNDS